MTQRGHCVLAVQYLKQTETRIGLPFFKFLARPFPLKYKKLMFMFMIMFMLMIVMSLVGLSLNNYNLPSLERLLTLFAGLFS